MFERVLICTDFSDGLHRLVEFVPSLALTGMKQIVFLHSIPFSDQGIMTKVDSEKMEKAESRLVRAISSITDGVEVKIEVKSGQPVETILKVAQAEQSELIILGSQSRTLFTEKLVGSTMAELSRRATIPLLVLRPQLISAFTNEELNLRCQHLFRSLLLPYNDSKEGNYLVEQVKLLAQKQSGKSLEKCLLCWVLDDMDRRDRPRKILPEQAQEILSRIKVDLEGVNLQVETAVEEGHPVTKVLEVTKTSDISAIAVSSGTIGKLQEWLVTSFAGEMLRQSWHPVLFFPPQRS